VRACLESSREASPNDNARPLLTILLRALAWISRRVHPRGTDWILRRLHSPDERGAWSIKDRVRLRDGALIELDTASWIEWRLFFFGEYEPELSEALRSRLGEGDIAIDVGANIGIHSLTMAEVVGASGCVLACEPHPRLARKLRSNLALNGAERVAVVEAAIGERPGVVDLAIAPPEEPNQGRATLRPLTSEDWRSTRVPCVTIDALATELDLPFVSLIKIDVEGHEPAVLSGATMVLREHQPVLIFEYSDYWPANSLSRVLERLRDCGYTDFSSLAGTAVSSGDNELVHGNILALHRSGAPWH
jgi:FkbM family methyltransferase